MASRAANRWSSSGYREDLRPLAADIPTAVRLLNRSIEDVERATLLVEPYVCADGTLKWPLRELARALADCGGIRAGA